MNGNVIVKPSPLGHAIFSLTRFDPAAQIGEITGRLIEDPDYGSEYCIECGEGRSLEPAAPFRFLNHSCEPNCEVIFWEGESTRDWELCLHSIKVIEPGDELTIDYAWPVSNAIPCRCRSPRCRGWIVAEEELPLIQV